MHIIHAVITNWYFAFYEGRHTTPKGGAFVSLPNYMRKTEKETDKDLEEKELEEKNVCFSSIFFEKYEGCRGAVPINFTFC